MAPGGSSTDDGFREFYAPRATETPKTPEQQSMPRVEHQKRQRPIELHNSHRSKDRTKPDDEDQTEAGCWGEIKNYKAGDEFVLLWKWVDDFMDKQRAKSNSSKSHNVNRSALSSRETRQVPRPAVTPSSEAVRRQTTDTEDLREYNAQRHTLWSELLLLYRKWKDQQAKKRADQARQKGREKTAKNRATEPRDESTRGRSKNRREPPQTNPSPPEHENPANSQPGIERKPIPVYNKKRGEVKKHTVKIAQLPPIHNSVHLQHTSSRNYRTNPSPARGQNDRSNRNTRFSDFLHQERNVPPSQKPAPSRETQWTYAVPGEDDGQMRESRFSSVLDPAKPIKKAKEAEKAKGPKCYICGSSNCPGGLRDKHSNLWVCEACQKRENIGPVECSVCGQPNSPNTGYAANGLWMCSACRNPTTPKELPPSPKFSDKATTRPKASRPPIPQGIDKDKSRNSESCECDSPCPSIETFDDKRFFTCFHCHKRLTSFPVILAKSASRASLVSQSVPIEEYNSDHLYSDDSYETRATTPPSQKPIGLGITFQDSEGEEDLRPTPPLKDSKYYQESPVIPPMDYGQSYLHRPGAKHPYASSPAPPTTTRKASVSFAHDASSKQRPRQNQPFDPTAHAYQSPPGSSTSLHKPRPASSVYPADEQAATDFPYPPPPIPLKFANRPKRSSSVNRGALSKAALARAEPGSPRSQSSPVSTEGGRNRRSSWYDFWKPVFDPAEEKKSP